MTKHWWLILVTWLAWVAPGAGAGLSVAYGGNSEHGQPGLSDSCLLNNVAKSSADLGDWPYCPARPPSATTMRLCKDASDEVDGRTFRATRDRLRAGVSDTDALCQIDAALVRSQQDCALAQHPGDVNLITGLMSTLAYNWQQQGNFERADQLYRRAYAMLEKGNGSILGKMGVLQDWGHLKLAIGETQRAKEIAEFRTAVARKNYQTGKSEDFSTRVLIAALEFQVWIFERIGLAREAGAAQQEAEALSAQLEPCIGLCGEVTRKVK